MRKFKEFFNSEGLTLIEILVSIVLIGIILIAFTSFIGQSMMFSSKIEQNLSAVNIADRILYEFRATDELSSLTPKVCPDSTNAPLDFLPKDSHNKRYYEINSQKYYPTILVCQSIDEKKLNLYRIHVQISDENSKYLSELIDYIN